MKFALRKSIFERDGGRCKHCGVKVTLFGTARDIGPFSETLPGHIDHIHPRFHGGSDDPSNLQLLCLLCNTRKGKKIA